LKISIINKVINKFRNASAVAAKLIMKTPGRVSRFKKISEAEIL